MKRLFFATFFVILLTLTFSVSVFAVETSGSCGTNLSWSFDEQTETLSITGRGMMNDYTPLTQPWKYLRDRVKHISLSGLSYIGNFAFYRLVNVKEIEIPSSVTKIGSAFYDCTALETVSGMSGVRTFLKDAFYGCKALKNITLPIGIINISDSMFGECYSLEHIDIPEGVIKISSKAFAGAGLKTVSLPSTLSKIEDESFRKCRSLESITFPQGLTYIGELAFQLCQSLRSVVFPKSLTTLGEYSFWACSSLKVMVNNSENVTCDKVFSDMDYGVPEKVVRFPESSILYTANDTKISKISRNIAVAYTYGETFSSPPEADGMLHLPDSPGAINGEWIDSWGDKAISYEGGMSYCLEYSLQHRIDSESGEICLFKDYCESVSVKKGSAVLIDLNGHTLCGEEGKHCISAFGTLVLKDRKNSGFVEGIGGNAIYANGGSVTVESGTVYGKLLAENGGKISATGGWFSEKLDDSFAGEGLKPTEKLESFAPNAKAPYTVGFSVSFVSDGVTVMSVVLLEGMSVSLPETPEKDGFSLIGWFCGEKTYSAKDTYSGETVFTARWTDSPVLTEKIRDEGRGAVFSLHLSEKAADVSGMTAAAFDRENRMIKAHILTESEINEARESNGFEIFFPEAKQIKVFVLGEENRPLYDFSGYIDTNL